MHNDIPYGNCMVEVQTHLRYRDKDAFIILLLGAWICFGKIDIMQKSILSVAIQLIQGVMDSLKAQKASVLVENEEVNLIPTAACFATVTPIGMPNDPFKQSFDYFSSVPSALSELPRELLQRLRSVSFTRPDIRIISEVGLVANGFTTAFELAEAMFRLQGLCEMFIPCFAAANRQVQNPPACTPKSSGWSILCVKKIINDAANNLYESGLETKQMASGAEVLVVPDSAGQVLTSEEQQGLYLDVYTIIVYC